MIADFYRPGTNNLFTKTELEERFNVVMSDNLYIELKYISLASKKETCQSKLEKSFDSFRINFPQWMLKLTCY